MPVSYLLRLSLLLCVLPAAGCGVETYQARITGNSNPFFAYHDELNANLSPRWSKGEVSLRLPLSLKERPAPRKDEENVRDPRIPDGLNVDELTGLLGGFRGEIQAGSRENSSATVPISAMVLSNRVLLASRDRKVKPGDFEQIIINRISEGLGNVEPSPTRRKVVGGRDFAPAIDYEETIFEAPGASLPVRYEVYFHFEGPLQVAVVFAMPPNLTRRDALDRQIDLALQTLQLTSGGESSTATPRTSGSRPSF